MNGFVLQNGQGKERKGVNTQTKTKKSILADFSREQEQAAGAGCEVQSGQVPLRTNASTSGRTEAMSERFLTLAKVRVLLGVSRATVWRWVAERGLKVVTIGGVTRIRESDLQAFLSRHESGGECLESPRPPEGGL